MNRKEEIEQILGVKIVSVTEIIDKPTTAWEQLVCQAKSGKRAKYDVLPKTFKEMKAELMQDPEFRAEYERLRPEFELDIPQPPSPSPLSVPRRADGKRKFLHDYLPEELFKAVRFAAKMISEGKAPGVAYRIAANYYHVDRKKVAHYCAQYAGTISGRIR